MHNKDVVDLRAELERQFDVDLASYEQKFHAWCESTKTHPDTITVSLCTTQFEATKKKLLEGKAEWIQQRVDAHIYTEQAKASNATPPPPPPPRSPASISSSDGNFSTELSARSISSSPDTYQSRSDESAISIARSAFPASFPSPPSSSQSTTVATSPPSPPQAYSHGYMEFPISWDRRGSHQSMERTVVSPVVYDNHSSPSEEHGRGRFASVWEPRFGNQAQSLPLPTRTPMFYPPPSQYTRPFLPHSAVERPNLGFRPFDGVREQNSFSSPHEDRFSSYTPSWSVVAPEPAPCMPHWREPTPGPSWICPPRANPWQEVRPSSCPPYSRGDWNSQTAYYSQARSGVRQYSFGQNYSGRKQQKKSHRSAWHETFRRQRVQRPERRNRKHNPRRNGTAAVETESSVDEIRIVEEARVSHVDIDDKNMSFSSDLFSNEEPEPANDQGFVIFKCESSSSEMVGSPQVDGKPACATVSGTVQSNGVLHTQSKGQVVHLEDHDKCARVWSSAKEAESPCAGLASFPDTKCISQSFSLPRGHTGTELRQERGLSVSSMGAFRRSKSLDQLLEATRCEGLGSLATSVHFRSYPGSLNLIVGRDEIPEQRTDLGTVELELRANEGGYLTEAPVLACEIPSKACVSHETGKANGSKTLKEMSNEVAHADIVRLPISTSRRCACNDALNVSVRVVQKTNSPDSAVSQVEQNSATLAQARNANYPLDANSLEESLFENQELPEEFPKLPDYVPSVSDFALTKTLSERIWITDTNSSPCRSDETVTSFQSGVVTSSTTDPLFIGRESTSMFSVNNDAPTSVTDKTFVAFDTFCLVGENEQAGQQKLPIVPVCDVYENLSFDFDSDLQPSPDVNLSPLKRFIAEDTLSTCEIDVLQVAASPTWETYSVHSTSPSPMSGSPIELFDAEVKQTLRESTPTYTEEFRACGEERPTYKDEPELKVNEASEGSDRQNLQQSLNENRVSTDLYRNSPAFEHRFAEAPVEQPDLTLLQEDRKRKMVESEPGYTENITNRHKLLLNSLLRKYSTRVEKFVSLLRSVDVTTKRYRVKYRSAPVYTPWFSPTLVSSSLEARTNSNPFEATPAAQAKSVWYQ